MGPVSYQQEGKADKLKDHNASYVVENALKNNKVPINSEVGPVSYQQEGKVDKLIDRTVSTSKKLLKFKKQKNLKKRRSITKLKMTVSTPNETKTLGMGIIECIMAFFKLMNTIFTNSLNISVGICLILALQSALSQAAATSSRVV